LETGDWGPGVYVWTAVGEAGKPIRQRFMVH
jgi:hypothetical protein